MHHCIINGEIDSDTVLKLHEDLSQLNADKRVKTINILIHSVGGSYYDGLAMYHMLKTNIKPVHTIGGGIVASAAMLPYMAGKKRVASSATWFLFHEGASTANGSQKYSEIMIDVKHGVSIDEQYNKIVAKESGAMLKLISKLNSRTNYITGEAAAKIGIVTNLISL